MDGTARESVQFDESRITRVVPHKVSETILWSEIAEIAIATNDMGPLSGDVHWVISHTEKNKGVVVSIYAEGLPELLEEFQKLPAFDNQRVIDAMGCAGGGWFVIWSRDTRICPV